MLDDSDAGGTGARQVAASVEADVTEALNDESLAAPARGCSDLAHVRCFVDEVLQSVENAASGGRDTSVNAALVDGLSGDASVCVDVVVADGLGVCVGDPAHLTFASSHVWGGDVDSWSNESLLGQLEGEATSNLLQLVLGVFLGVDLDAGLGSAEWNVNAGALEGHQSRQGLDFIAADVH